MFSCVPLMLIAKGNSTSHVLSSIKEWLHLLKTLGRPNSTSHVLSSIKEWLHVGAMAPKKTLCGKQVIGSSNAFLLNSVNGPRSICFANHNLRALQRISLLLLCSIALHKGTRRWTGFVCHALHGKLSRGW